MTTPDTGPTPDVELRYPANLRGFNPRCPDCRRLLGTEPPDAREYRFFHDAPDGTGHDLCPTGPPFVAGSLGLLGDWDEEVVSL